MRPSVGIVLCLTNAQRAATVSGRAILEPGDVAGAVLDLADSSGADVLRARLAAIDLSPLRVIKLPSWLRDVLIAAADLARAARRTYYDLNNLREALVNLQADTMRNDITAALRALPDPLPDLDEPSPTHGHARMWSSAYFGQASVARRVPDEDPGGP